MEDAFIGMDALKREHAAQVAAFRRWAQARDWATFHASHYDWWAFPVNRASRYGNRYRLTPEAVKALQADTAFLALWREGVSLVCLAWGWDLSAAHWVDDLEPAQRWSRWPVRLYKMALSAWLFQQPEVYASLRKLAQCLQITGETFTYDGHDLWWVFESPSRPDRH